MLYLYNRNSDRKCRCYLVNEKEISNFLNKFSYVEDSKGKVANAFNSPFSKDRETLHVLNDRGIVEIISEAQGAVMFRLTNLGTQLL